MIVKIWEVKGFTVPPPYERTLKMLFSPELSNTDKVTVLAALIPPGRSTDLHIHDGDEVIYVASGRGVFILGDKEYPVEPDMVLYAKAKAPHGMKNTGDEMIKLICFFTPPLKPVGRIEKAIEAAKGHAMSR